MTLRKRPRFNGSADDHAATEQWSADDLRDLRTDPADGATYDSNGNRLYSGASDIGLPTAPAGPPAITMAGRQAPWVMTVNPGRPGQPTPQALEVARFLRAKVTILRRRGQLDRISDAKLLMLPGDRRMNKRTTARLIVDEAAELLRCSGETS